MNSTNFKGFFKIQIEYIRILRIQKNILKSGPNNNVVQILQKNVDVHVPFIYKIFAFEILNYHLLIIYEYCFRQLIYAHHIFINAHLSSTKRLFCPSSSKDDYYIIIKSLIKMRTLR